jgi:hypothetical protein
MEILFHGCAEEEESGLPENGTAKDFHGMKDADRYRLLGFPIPSLYRPMH